MVLQSLLARPKACVFDIKTSASMAVPPWFALPWVSPGGSYRASTKRPSPIGTGLAQARRKIKTPKGKTLEFFKRTLTAATVPTRRTTMSKISIVGATLLAAAVLSRKWGNHRQTCGCNSGGGRRPVVVNRHAIAPAPAEKRFAPAIAHGRGVPDCRLGPAARAQVRPRSNSFGNLIKRATRGSASRAPRF